MNPARQSKAIPATLGWAFCIFPDRAGGEKGGGPIASGSFGGFLPVACGLIDWGERGVVKLDMQRYHV